jgi:hypothetical protein
VYSLSQKKQEVSHMEIEIPFSVKVSLAEDKANINDVVKSLRRVLDETGRNTGTDSIIL